MHISKYRIYKALIAGLMGIAVAIAVVTDTAIVALLAVIAGIAVAAVLERHTREIVRDERIAHISGRSATASFYAMLILGAVISLGAALFRRQLPEDIVFAGAIMGYFICVALILNMCFYAYFSRKL